MGLRITTWNVNGIKNPFGYQPWRDKKTFEGMFEILESDIIIMQECKIQRKDLRDDMVLVNGWDVYFSLPKHKKGYSGVAIYTRNESCAPIRVEEGITGILSRPNSSISFRDLPSDEQIGGYPEIAQLTGPLDATILDSEGRCVVMEFPAFVLIGTYCPANRDETRDDFRLGFLNALDARIRNLVAMGKQVFLTGDLNIIREELDTANAEEQLKKHNMIGAEYVSTPARRLFNQLIFDGKVIGARDKGREEPVLWDICRTFHPTRKAMFTCWETKVNARPGNFGSRIDYVLCSAGCKDWICESNIQEGLMGSDHCPVFAVLKDTVQVNGEQINVRDIMNPAGMFEGGRRVRDWAQKDLLPMSGRLIPEFDRRQSIRDMFAKETKDQRSLRSNYAAKLQQNSNALEGPQAPAESTVEAANPSLPPFQLSALQSTRVSSNSTSPVATVKRTPETSNSRPFKRTKPTISARATNAKRQSVASQSTLTGFFKPKQSEIKSGEDYVEPMILPAPQESTDAAENNCSLSTRSNSIQSPSSTSKHLDIQLPLTNAKKPFSIEDQKDVIDPIVAKESWGKLLTKRTVPRCEHDESCISFLTKKPGINCGRSFYMCSRPLGPSGAKEKNTQWRCGTFIWSSDWTGDGT